MKRTHQAAAFIKGNEPRWGVKGLRAAMLVMLLALFSWSSSRAPRLLSTTTNIEKSLSLRASSPMSMEQWLRREGNEVKCDWLHRQVDSGYWFSDLQPDDQPDFTLLSAWLKPEYPIGVAAPETIPEMYMEGFTMGGKVPISTWYLNQAYLGGKASTSYWSVEMVEQLMERARQKQMMKYGEDSQKIYSAMDKYHDYVSGKHGIVIGSEDPWVESILLVHGASQVFTLEFGEITTSHPKLQSMVPNQFTESFINKKIEPFDFGFSYSSLEHDGLGRYGDVLNPIGDLQSMAKMLSVIKPGGIFFLGVPTGSADGTGDAIAFNAHRIYGTTRLPKVLAGWKLIDIVHDDYFEEFHQHVIVLQNRNGCIQ